MYVKNKSYLYLKKKRSPSKPHFKKNREENISSPLRGRDAETGSRYFPFKKNLDFEYSNWKCDDTSHSRNKFFFHHHLLSQVLLAHSFMDCSFARTVVQTDSIFFFFDFWRKITCKIITLRFWKEPPWVCVLVWDFENEINFRGNQTWDSFQNFWKSDLENE